MRNTSRTLKPVTQTSSVTSSQKNWFWWTFWHNWSIKEETLRKDEDSCWKSHFLCKCRLLFLLKVTLWECGVVIMSARVFCSCCNQPVWLQWFCKHVAHQRQWNYPKFSLDPAFNTSPQSKQKKKDNFCQINSWLRLLLTGLIADWILGVQRLKNIWFAAFLLTWAFLADLFCRNPRLSPHKQYKTGPASSGTRLNEWNWF